MRRILLGLFALTFTLALVQLAPSRAHAASTGPCVAGTRAPICHFWTGSTTFIADGDTIRVDIDGDHTATPQTIRFLGINAMELHRYSKYPDRRVGDCHGLEATALIERYINQAHGRVRLSAQHADSVTGTRLHRSVAVYLNGAWQDLGRIEMEQGQALWLPNSVEYAHNLEYHKLAEQAAARQLNLYDPTYCGFGPAQDAQLKMTVNWDADGNDTANLNGEWVELRNTGTTDVPLGGWWLRDSFLRYNANGIPGFEFPSTANVPPGGAVTLHMGCGSNTATQFYWCQRSSVFENVTRDRTHMGDGGYLFDPQGDLRFSSTYPCVYSCHDPLAGKVRLSAHPTTPESISIKNVSHAPIDLDGHLLKLHLNGSRDQFILSYPFGPGSIVGPGETLKVQPSGSPRTNRRLSRHLGRGTHVLSDSGNVVSLRTFTDIVTACYAWGRKSC